MMHTLRRVFILIFPFLVLSLMTCDVEELDNALNYSDMLKQAYGRTGEGRIIPLTIENAIEVDGSITKSGRFLYFTSNRDRGNYDIYLRSMKDITTVRITEHASKDYSPAVSPNGKYLAYISQKDDPEGDLFVLRVNSGSLVRREADVKEEVDPLDSRAKNISAVVVEETGMRQVIKDANPAWSPDNRFIAFSSERDGTENIWIVRRNGDDLRQLTFNGGMYPAFSPDGEYIVFVSYRDEKNNGDIYTVHVETGTVKQITDNEYIEMNPTFTGNGYEIVYTLFDKDTNDDGVIDLDDKSILQYRHLQTGQSYPLTFYSVSSFSPRYFPVYSMRFEDTEEINFNGVIVYAQQIGENIDLNIIPEYGVIPKRQSAGEQYETALKYLQEDNDYERYLMGLMRVYYFFGDSLDDESQIFTSRALKIVALEAYRNNNQTESWRMHELLAAEEESGGENPYMHATISFLNTVLRGEDGGPVLQEALESLDEDSSIRPYLMEDIANYYRDENKTEEALLYYERIQEDYPDYIRLQYVNYNAGILLFNADDSAVPEELVSVMAKGTAYQKDETVRFMMRRYVSDLVPSSRIGRMEELIEAYDENEEREYRIITAMARYIIAQTRYNRNDPVVKEDLTARLDTIDQETVLYYSINRLLADISLRKEMKEEEEQYLFAALNSYKGRWNQADLEEIVLRLIEFYEQRGRQYEKENKFRKASNVYKNYTEFLSSLKDKRIKKFDAIYDDYGTRAHVLRIDTFYKYKNYSYESLESLRADYLDGISRARRNFDKSYMFGLAYIYAKLGYHLDTAYKEDPELTNVRTTFEPDAEKISAELITRHFKNSLDNLEWSLYMDDSFSDSYLLKGWIYHYIDSRRNRELSKQSQLGYLYEQYFPDYLLESVIDVYERALETNNELKFPEKEGNIYLNMANTYFVLVNYPEALKNYQAAAKYKTVFSSKEQQALFYFHLGYCYYQTGDIANATEQMKKVERIYSVLSGGSVNNRYAWNLITIYRYYSLFARVENDYTETIRWYRRILDVAARYNVQIDRARYLQEIAYCHIQLKEYDRANEYLNRADTLLESYDETDTPKHNLRITYLGLLHFSIGLSEDQTVFGESRLYREFDTFTKKIYSLTLRELLHRTKGDYNEVIQVLNDKVKFIKGKKLKIHREIRLRTYNNLGHAYFLTGDFEKSERQFTKAWDYAEKNENQNGMFMAIGNLTSLYSYLFENNRDYFDDPLRRINRLVEDIQAYGADYERIETRQRIRRLRERNEFRGLPEPTYEEERRVAEQVQADARQKYRKLDIYQSTLNFYKAELLFEQYEQILSNPSRRTDERIYAYNKEIYDLYSRSASVFEKSLDKDDTDNRTRLKLMLNASVCRERLGQIDNSFEFLEQAQELAEEYSYDDSLVLIYMKEAEFLRKHTKEVGYDISRAADYYDSALALIESLPQQFIQRIPLVESLYDDYCTFLISREEYGKAFDIRERKRRFQLITQMYIVSPELSDEAENSAFQSYKYAVNEIIIQKERLTTALESGRASKDELDRIRKKIDTNSEEIKEAVSDESLLYSFIRYQDGIIRDGDEKKDQSAAGDIVFDFYIFDNTIHAWRYSRGSVTHSSASVPDGTTARTTRLKQGVIELVDTLLPDEEQSKDVYIILSEEIYPVLTDTAETDGDFENLPEYTYVFSVHDVPFVERMSRSLLTSGYSVGRDVAAEAADRDLLQHSVLVDNASPAGSLSRSLFGGEIRPSLLIRNDRDSYRQKRLIYYGSLYSGNANVIFTHAGMVGSLAEKDTLLSEYETFGEMNSVSESERSLIVTGKGGIVTPEEEEYQKIAESLFDSYQQNMIRGNVEDAKYYLFRWRSAASGIENLEYRYALYLASIDSYTDNPNAAVEVLGGLDLAELQDSELKNMIHSHRILYMLQAGNTKSVSEYFGTLQEDEDPFIQTPDYQFYNSFITQAGNSRPIVNIPDDMSVDSHKAGILAAKYNMIFGNRAYAEENIAGTLTEESLLSESDMLFVQSVTDRELPVGRRLSRIVSIRQAETVDQIKELYESTVYQDGRYDVFSPFALYYVMNRLPDIYKTSLLNYVARDDTLRDIRAQRGGIDGIIFLQRESDYYAAWDERTRYEQMLDQQQAEAERISLVQLLPYLAYKRALLFAENGEYNRMNPQLTDLEEIGEEHALYAQSLLLTAERDIARNRLDDAQETIDTLTSTNTEETVIRNLLQTSILLDRIRVNEEMAPQHEAQARQMLDEACDILETDRNILADFSRPRLFLKTCDEMIQYDSSVQRHAHALKVSDIKTQFLFMRAHRNDTLPQHKDTDYSALDSDASLEEVSDSLRTDSAAYFTSFLPVLTDDITESVMEDEVVVYFGKVGRHIYIWLIDSEGIQFIPLENGYSVFQELNTTYQRMLSDVQSISNVSSRINELFANAVSKINNYQTVTVVLDDSLNDITIENMGGDEIIIDTKNVRYLPTVSSLLLNGDDATNESVLIYVPSNVTINDRLEHLAIKESGMEYKTVNADHVVSENENIHVQMPVYYDTLSHRSVLKTSPYARIIKQTGMVYVSGSDTAIKNGNQFVMLNMMHGSDSIVINNTRMRDVNSAILIREFYTNINLGDDPFTAFSKAKKKLYYNSLYSHPSYWSYTRLYSL